MPETKTTVITTITSLTHLLGVLFLLIGVYGALRILHVNMKNVPYPIKGVLPSTWLTPGESISYGRETDCEPYPQIYYDYGTDGKQVSRPATPEETGVSQEQSKRCVRGFDEDRSKQEQYDKNETAFFLFLGIGLLASRRFLPL